MELARFWCLLFLGQLRSQDSSSMKYATERRVALNRTSWNSTSWTIYDVYDYERNVRIASDINKPVDDPVTTATGQQMDFSTDGQNLSTTPDPATVGEIYDSDIDGHTDDWAADVTDDVNYEDSDDYDYDIKLPTEQRLMNMLMTRYERAVRPVNNATETVLVRMGLTLTQIFDMDEKNQVLVTNVWLDQEWNDIFLTWNPEDFGGLRVLRLPCYKIWLPDIVLYNNAAEYTNSLMPANVMITYQGDVFWPIPTKLQSTCKIDITYFPFDEQLCRLKFGSWTYDGFQVDMTNRTTEVDLSNYVENGEWELLSIRIERNVVYYLCCEEPFPDVTFVVHIRRRIIYYIYNIIFPCVMMSMLTLLVFCLPPESSEKVTMGITVLLAFSVFLLRMGEDLPETSEFIPLLSIYLTIVMAMTSVSVVLTVFVLNLHYSNPNQKRVPPWLRRLFVRWNKADRSVTFDDSDGVSVAEYYTDGERKLVKDVPLRMTIENLAQELKQELDERSQEAFTELADGDVEWTSAVDVESDRRHQARSVSNPTSSLQTTEQILDALRSVIRRYEREDAHEFIVYEWRQVAVGVDKILFWIFLVGTLTSTILILVVSPLTKWF